MNCHQVLTGAANAGNHCYAVGSVAGIPFTAYAAGCNIVILASNFDRVQIIAGISHGNIQVGSLDCSTDIGKIAAAYGKRICIFEPTPLLNQTSSHRLDYQWVQTATILAECHTHVLSWNLEGTRLVTGGECIQMWHLVEPKDIDRIIVVEEDTTNGQITQQGDDLEDHLKWECVWKCKTAHPVTFLQFSPDGILFASAGKNDRLVKIWYANKKVSFSSQSGYSTNSSNVNYAFIYIAHPRAITGLSWRKTSKYMPKGSVANMLVTACLDNICRLWVQTLIPEDGLINLQELDGLSGQSPRSQVQRHRKNIMQRLKHMKSFNQFKKRQATQFMEDPHEIISILPSTFSVHDFHSFGFQGSSAVTPSLHFHLSASINAETDIPLVPSISGGNNSKDPNFVLHWLNNKEMAFTQAAESLLQEISQKLLQSELSQPESEVADSDDQESQKVSGIKQGIVKVIKSKKSGHSKKSESQETIDEDITSKHSFSTASSSASIATDVSNGNAQVPCADILDRNLDAYLRDWHQTPDLLFSIHPVDGSFLVWLVDWLDEYIPGSFRQAQVSFSSRIPNAISLGDAATMSHHLYLYSPYAGLDLHMVLSASTETTKDSNLGAPKAGQEQSSKHSEASETTEKKHLSSSSQDSPTPVVCMLSKHTNGSLNLWHLTFGDNSHYTQVLSISHASRVCGHRFRINDITCHPVLPLLLTTSHHNVPSQTSAAPTPTTNTPGSPCCPCNAGALQAGFCSELILWKVDPVGPLSKSGGITELARINSPETSAFANVAWIPTLLPSTTLGSISNSPSACFVASDGHQLRIYQAMIDARALLAEISTASRKKSQTDMSISSSSSSGLEYRHSSLQDTFKIVSLQSTARPGCVIELEAISDANHDWQNTQLLHVFQEQLITGDSTLKRNSIHEEDEVPNIGLVEPDLQAVVDLRHYDEFEEPFYLVVLEKQTNCSVLHMWRITIASQFEYEAQNQPFTYVPDSNLVQDSDNSNQSSRSNTPEPGKEGSSPHASPLRITTTKVCTQILPIPDDVEVVHATPAAGHLSSSNIYPACYAPYLICTACSDGNVRFWHCKPIQDGNSEEDSGQMAEQYTWVEWEMMLNKESSMVEVTGQPLFVSSAYSGRVAVAYKYGRSFTRPTSVNPCERFINISVSIFECESTGGSEWVLEDTIHLKNVSLPQPDISETVNIGILSNTAERNRRTMDTLIQRLSGSDDVAAEQAPNLQRLLAVPSYSTLHTLRRAIAEKGNQCLLTQKSLVQLDWVSTEDGSHILTVALGSKVLLFTPVSTDIAQANVQATKTPKTARRRLLKQASSMALPLTTDEIRWMRIRMTHLKTADNLPALPMQLSWVRHGILVVGMDSEMHIYTQWRSKISDNERSESEEVESIDNRKLAEQELLNRAQESSQLRIPSVSGTMSRAASSTLITTPTESKKKKDQNKNNTTGGDTLTFPRTMPDFGLFETSRLACPVLPQYHPKQLMELLGFGKLRRVKAILSHLVRCLSGTDNVKRNYLEVPDSQDATENDDVGGSRSWSRSRTLSIAAGASPLPHSPLDGQGSMSVFPEEVTLDYVEITSIPPLPLFTLLEADKEITTGSSPTRREGSGSNEDYSGLFDTGYQTEENLDDILHDRLQLGSVKRERQSFASSEKQVIVNFGPRQASLLTRLLTHSHLPGLSSLDQMHLLALADTVASFNVALSDRFDSAVEKQAPLKQVKGNLDGLNIQVSTDSLDDCGLRYLLSIRHFTYLLRCLPLGQRAQLQSQGLGSHSLVWAFHSETQEELLQMIPSVQKGNPRWSELRELGVGWWIRNNNILRRLMEKVAKAAFQVKSEPLDAALFYLAMKKKNLVWGLFRSVHDSKMTNFFQNNFTEDKWRKSALKNAFALMGKQRFEHAAAFFLLAGALNDAVDVCLNKLDDIQLATVIIRLHEGDLETTPPNLRKLLFDEILGCDSEGKNYIPSQAHPDPFLRSMARWILQDYCGALTTLLQTDIGHAHPQANDTSSTYHDGTSVNPSVFNFYLYLRTHPLVVRRQLAQSVLDKKAAKTVILSGFSQAEFKENLPSAVKDMSYEDTITPLERRLFFTTAHAHFRAGCPALALEVLSRLPDRVAPDGPLSPDDIPVPISDISERTDHISTGTLTNGDIGIKPTSKKISDLDWSKPEISVTSSTGGSAMDFDWGMPEPPSYNDSLDLKFDDDDNEAVSEEETGIEMKSSEAEKVEENLEEHKLHTKLDIMAQQLKFIACLKIMMEELSTLATGFEVDGGQLRYQLYIWLERSVAALRDLCSYGKSGSNSSAESKASMGTGVESLEHSRFNSSTDSRDPKPSLHEILLADKFDFEAKLQRSSRRKQWLKANEALLRTLLSYCSLHGAHGGGLAAVRMELILLLQELQQERSQQQLLSPLPFPTTLPLLAASVACQKTVVADPIRHLQAMVYDILHSICEVSVVSAFINTKYLTVLVLRDLSTSLSACIYQSLCDSDNFIVKQGGSRGLSMEDFISSSVVHQNSHLLAGHTRSRHLSTGEESLAISTPPSKWPGVQSLRALLARDKDEDSPRLHTLLCEAFVAVYLSQLIHALSTCDCHVLYRLVSQNFSEETWGMLFGGGAKKLLRMTAAGIPSSVTTVTTTSTTTTATVAPAEKESSIQETSLLNSLSKQRMKLHLKLLGQRGLSTTQPAIKEDRPTYREQFVPPRMSLVSCFMSKPMLPSGLLPLDYDSNESLPSDDDEEHEVDRETDDVFGEELDSTGITSTIRAKKVSDSGITAQLDPSSYSWGILRYAVVKLAHQLILRFLSIAGNELPDLPITSPLIHAVLKCMENWLKYLKEYMDSFEGPPLNYIPGCYVDNSQSGPAILKYKALLEFHNTPFRSNQRAAMPVKRLWNYLVHQENVQDIFIRYIFSRKPAHYQMHEDIGVHDTESVEGFMPNPVRIIHKDQDNISSFCISKVNEGTIALATPKEIQELDISILLEPIPWLEDEAEYDILNLLQPTNSVPASEYLVIQHPSDKIANHHGHSVGGSSYNSPTGPAPPALGVQTGRGTVVLKKHKTDGVRRLCAHPHLPLYISGAQNGSVLLWEWTHQQAVSSPRPAGTFAKVTRVLFNPQGNKYGVTDGDGTISLWQVGLTSSASRPFFSSQCHSKQASDFAFIGSSSLIATAGHSTENRNVCLWDTLLPRRKSLVSSFVCHDHGSSSILYAIQNQVLISAGKKGDICIFDIRQRQLRHKFTAHESAIKCLALDPAEEFFVTGSADGDIKVWGLSVHVLFYSFPGEHTKNTIFRNISSGVSQLEVDGAGRLFSCGADGSIKFRTLPDRDLLVNSVI